MLLSRQRGIILYSYFPEQYRVILLDHAYGKIDCAVRFFRNRVTPLQGALMSYVLEKNNRWWYIRDVEYIALPAPWVLQDVSFLHHILELWSVYLPAHQYPYALEDIIHFLYSTDYTAADAEDTLIFVKKMVRAKVILLLGLCPDLPVLNKVVLPVLEQFPAQYRELVATPALEEALSLWLYQALSQEKGHERLRTFSIISTTDARL